MATNPEFNQDRFNWNRAFALWQEARAASDADDARYDPIWRACHEACEAVPHRTFPADAFLGGTAERSTASHFDVGIARHVIEGKYVYQSEASQRHLAACRELVEAAEAREAEVRRIREEWGIEAHDEQNEALGSAAYRAEWALMDLPAPDLPALLWKLENLMVVDGPDSTTPSWSAEAVEQTMADARRLLV